MDPLRASHSEISIVLIGSFNPQIFQPAWFAAQGLLKAEEAETADISIIHPDVVAFTVDWCDMEIRRDRFVIATDRAPSPEPIRDLTLGTFTLLEHTPVKLLGVNHTLHYRLDSLDVLLSRLTSLAPNDEWEGVLEDPMPRTVVVWGKRSDDRQGRLGVTVEPSIPVSSGIFVALNDHVELADEGEVAGTASLLETLDDIWEPSRQRFQKIVDFLVEVGA